MADIQEYSVSIKFETKGTDKAASDTEKVGKSLDKIKSSTSGLSKLTSGFSTAGTALGKFSKVFKIVSGAGAIAGIVKLGKSVVNLGEKTVELSKNMSDYIETVNLFRTSMGSAAQKASEFVDKAESLLGLDPSSLMNSLASFQNLSEGFGIASDRAYIMSENLTQLAGDLSSFANISFDAAQKKLMSGFSGQVLPLRQYGIALDQASLQELAYSLGLDKKVKSMTRAQKTELIYYQIMKSTQKMQGDLGRTLMSPANALRVLQTEFKQLARAVGSIFIPLIQRVIPIMRAVTKALTQAATAIAKFFGFNVDDYTVSFSNVEDSIGGIADGIDDIGNSADGTAKKLNKMLMPFDELNNINSSDSSGSGSGSGYGVGGGSLGIDLPTYDMFENINDSILKFENVLEGAKRAAQKFNEVLAEIDWATIKKSAEEIGTNLGKFVNIGITEIDWRLVGSTIGEGINTMITGVENFLEQIDFKQLGEDASDAVEGFFDTVEWEKVGQTLSTGVEGALDTMLEFDKTFDSNKVGEAFGRLFSNIKWGEILPKLASVVTNALGLNPMRGIKLIGSIWQIIKGWFQRKWEDIQKDIEMMRRKRC